MIDMYYFNFELSKPFRDKMEARFGHDPELLNKKFEQAAHLLEMMLRRTNTAEFEAYVKNDLFDPQATFIAYKERNHEEEIRLPFANAYYMCGEYHEGSAKLMMEHLHEMPELGANHSEYAYTPLYYIYENPAMREQWDCVIQQPDVNPNTSLDDSKKDRHRDMKFANRTSYRTGIEFVHLGVQPGAANILEYLCQEQIGATSASSPGKKNRIGWRREKIDQLLDAGCLITHRTRDLIELCEVRKVLEGVSDRIAAKELRLKQLMDGTIPIQELTGQDIKDACAVNMLAPLFMQAHQDDEVAQALLRACDEAPKWLQDELVSGLTILRDLDRAEWVDRTDDAGHSRSGGIA